MFAPLTKLVAREVLAQCTLPESERRILSQADRIQTAEQLATFMTKLGDGYSALGVNLLPAIRAVCCAAMAERQTEVGKFWLSQMRHNLDETKLDTTRIDAFGALTFE